MNTENEKDYREFKIRKIICPILLYYVMGLIAQLIYCIYNMPTVILKFIEEKSEYFEEIGLAIEGVTDFELVALFYESLTEEVYLEFLYTFAYQLMEATGVLTIMTAAISIPILALMRFRDYRKQEIKINKVGPKYRYIYLMLGAITLCIGLNCMLSLSGLMVSDTNYENTAQALYSMPLALQIIGLGIVVPVAEELLYRAVIFLRFEQNFSLGLAIIMNAITFGTVHGNIVQFIYAFLCGIVFAWLYLEFGSVMAPIVAHCIMNLISIVASDLYVFTFLFKSQMHTTIAAVAGLTLTSVFYVLIVNSKDTTNKEV